MDARKAPGRMPAAVPYANARTAIHDGDMLLFRPRSWFGWLISVGTFDPQRWIALILGKATVRHCHVGRASWWGESLWSVQQTSNPYKHLERLSVLVRRWPGKIDVYQVRDKYESHYDRDRAIETHKDVCLRPYGWLNLLRLVPRHLLLARRLLPNDTDDQATSKFPPFCSMAYSMSDRAGGIDPCPDLADRETEPHHLAESPYYRHVFTLI